MKTKLLPHESRTALATYFLYCLIALAFTSAAAEPQELPIAHDEYLYMIRFASNGKTLVTAAGDNVARVWHWPSRKLLHTLVHDAAVYTADYSADQELIATGSGDGKVSLWEAATSKLVAQRQDHADAVYCLSFAPNGKELATIGGDGRKGDTQCRIWSVPTMELAKTLPGHDRPAYGVLFGPPASKTRSLVTSGGDKLIHVYARSSDAKRTLKGHTSDVYRCCFSPDGAQLASTSQDGSLRIWDVATGRQAKMVFQAKDPMYDVAYSRDGSVLAAVGDDGFVRFWSTKTFELLGESRADKEGLYTITFTPDQSSVLTGGVRGKVYQCPLPRLETK